MWEFLLKDCTSFTYMNSFTVFCYIAAFMLMLKMCFPISRGFLCTKLLSVDMLWHFVFVNNGKILWKNWWYFNITSYICLLYWGLMWHFTLNSWYSVESILFLCDKFRTDHDGECCSKAEDTSTECLGLSFKKTV